MKPNILLLVAIVGLAAPVHAELQIEEFRAAHGDFSKAARRVTPDIELSGYYIPDASFTDADEELDILRYELDATVPLPISRDSFLIAGAHAGARDYNVTSDSGFEDETVYNLGLRFGGGRFLNDDFAVQGYWQPSIYSDLDGTLNSRDWKPWYGTMLAVYRSSDTFFWKGGFQLTDALDTGIIPLAGFAWLFAPDWRVELLAPRNLEISHTPSDGWNLHAGVRIEAEEYTVRQPVGEDGEERELQIHIKDIRFYAGVLHKLESGLSLFTRAGVACYGEYEWSDEFQGDMEPAPFVNAGLGWHF